MAGISKESVQFLHWHNEFYTAGFNLVNYITNLAGKWAEQRKAKLSAKLRSVALVCAEITPNLRFEVSDQFPKTTSKNIEKRRSRGVCFCVKSTFTLT